MKMDEIVRKVQLARPEISREEFLKMVEERRKSLGNYFTDEVVAKVIASELGVNLSGKPAEKFEISIKNITSGLDDVTVSGEVVALYPVRVFKKMLEKEGKLARIIIADETGKMNVVLWNEHAALVEKGIIEKGKKIRVSHGYVREGFRGKLELHVGDNGEIEVFEDKWLKIKDLKAGDGPVNVIGRVISENPLIRKVKTSKGEEVLLANFEVEDETGCVQVSMWRRLAEQIKEESLRKGTLVKLRNFYVKKGFTGGLEIFSRKNSSFEIISDN